MTTWMNLQGIIHNKKKPILLDYILYDFIYITLSKWQKLRS